MTRPGLVTLCRRVSAVVFLVCAVAGDLHAQGFFARPLRRDRPLQQTLTLEVDGAGGSDTLRRLESTGERNIDRPASFGTGSTALKYSLDRSWLSAGVYAASVARYFSARADRLEVQNFGSANAAIDLPLSGRARLTSGASTLLRPVTAMTLFPGMFGVGQSQMAGLGQPGMFGAGQLGLFGAGQPTRLPIDFDLGSRLGRESESQADARISYALSRTSGISAGYRVLKGDGPFYRRGYMSQRGEVRYHQTLTRLLSVHAGFGRDVDYLRTDEGRRQVVVRDLLDLGFDFGLSRTLALSRRLTVSFDTGSSIVSYGGARRFYLTGNAALDYQFKRVWALNATYSRGLDYNAAFLLPLFSDNLAAGVNGRLGRLDLSSRSGVSTGTVGLDRGDAFRAYYSGLDASMDVGRFFAATAGYHYYNYRFDQATLLPAQFGTEIRRHSVSVGANVELPLIGRVRRRAYVAR